MSNSQRSLLAAVTLFFVAPLVAEYLLGDFSITFLSPMIMMAPMYGGGALIIRELTRRTGRGWPTILLLGCAYCLIEEGYTTQTLFNPDAFGLHMHLLSHAWMPALGISAWWTLFMLNVHPFWSIGVSIALVEGLFPSRARTPWLGNIGVSVAAVLFAAAVYFSTVFSIRRYHFIASAAQFTVTGVIAILFIAAALLTPKPTSKSRTEPVPSPWLFGVATFLLAAAVFLAPIQFNWVAVGWILAADLLFLLLLWVFSRCIGWTALHTFSIGAAGAIFYGVHAFLQGPVVPAPKQIVLMSHVIMLVAALAAVAIGVSRIKADRVPSSLAIPDASV
ncbi:MAG TPA: hypothetical protein VGG45_04785 [Terracidiphilus sp.]